MKPFRVLSFLFLLCIFACGDDLPLTDPEGSQPADHPYSQPCPIITWAMSSGRFHMTVNETLMLVPDIENTDETTTYLWEMDDRVVSQEDSYSFTPESAGDYFIKLTVTNRYGSSTDEVKVTVSEQENTELPALPDEHRLWCFPWTEMNISLDRTVKVKAYILQEVPEAHYTWTLDGQEAEGLTDEAAYIFHATQEGRHILTLTMTSNASSQSQDFILNVCPAAGVYRRSGGGQALVNKIYEYMPAPGHQVNGYIIVGDSYPADCTHEQACDSVLKHFQKKWSVSLGAQGGYLIAGFDHSVRNSNGGYDLCIKGNPYDYQSEPGIIWVSQDDNGDGLPNDQWFELAGSEYGSSRSTQEYAITYYRPDRKKSATAWRDCFGDTGYVPYMSYWNPHDYYWQPWITGTEHTYFGTRLQDRSSYEGNVSTIPPYDWGYVDNLGSDFFNGPAGMMNYFRLSNARTWDGQPANLEYIDFVKVQTAQTGSTPNLGDISTEIYYISDYHLE